MTQIEWHAFSAWQIEDEHLQVVIVPPLGAKIASLIDKSTGDEWLAAPTHSVRPRLYGDIFTDHDLSGWDEMFPTINACRDPLDPARLLPDHGEVWAMPWEVKEQVPESISLRVTGQALAYRLTRRAVIQQGKLRLEYELENRSGVPMPFLWAAHPLFNGGPDCEVRLPEEVTKVINAVDHPVLGVPNVPLMWPVTRLRDGRDKALNVVGNAARNDYWKVYLQPEQTIHEACLRRGRRQLQMRWNVDVAPYLGIWIDEGTYTHTSTVALEPATGFYDALDQAYRNGRVAMAPVTEPLRWSLEVGFSDIRES